MRRTRNEQLAPPPDEDVIAAVATIVERHRESRSYLQQQRGAIAVEVGRQLGLKGHRRGGNGAVKGSWSGTMSPALRVAPILLRLARAGKLRAELPVGEYRWEFWPPEES